MHFGKFRIFNEVLCRRSTLPTEIRISYIHLFSFIEGTIRVVSFTGAAVVSPLLAPSLVPFLSVYAMNAFNLVIHHSIKTSNC